jgi:hypothetical protein
MYALDENPEAKNFFKTLNIKYGLNDAFKWKGVENNEIPEYASGGEYEISALYFDKSYNLTNRNNCKTNNNAYVNYELEEDIITKPHVKGYGSENCGVKVFIDFDGLLNSYSYDRNGSISDYEITHLDLNRRYKYLKKTNQLQTIYQKLKEEDRLERESRPVDM